MRLLSLAILTILTSRALADDPFPPERKRVVTTETKITILSSINFDVKQAVLKPAAFPMLDAVATTLKENPELLLLEVQGHGDDTEDQALTEARAHAVVGYLVEKGVAAARLSAKGYGFTQPLDPKKTTAARAKNRRVGFMILKHQ